MVAQKRVIVLEGLPGSGKTSLARFLRDTYRACLVNESLGAPGINSGNQLAIFQETLERYGRARSAIGLVVIDRGYPSMLAWDYCREQDNFSNDFAKKYS